MKDERLPESVLTKKQTKAVIKVQSIQKLIVKIRYDDECGNDHNTFAITADLYQKNKYGHYEWWGGGMMHEKIAEFCPELKKYIKWHLTSSDGPMHYIANTIYHAGDKDCWGGRKGEVRAYRYNVKAPNGNMVFEIQEGHEFSLPDKKEAAAMAERMGGEIVPVPWLLHEGKERQLDYARSSAVWPEATDEELMADDLKERLEARLSALMQEFKKDMEELGFVY